MFLPESIGSQEVEAKKRRDAMTRLENWCKELIPAEIIKGVEINIQEVQCGDPECSPVDTSIVLLFDSGESGMIGLPMEAANVTKEFLKDYFPTRDVLEKWHRGEEAEWPPLENEDYSVPLLRFDVGDLVECRIGPDPVKGWLPGVIMQQWYRENNWPRDAWAPYKVLLDDGRKIYAPGDVDQIIRLRRVSQQNNNNTGG